MMTKPGDAEAARQLKDLEERVNLLSTLLNAATELNSEIELNLVIERVLNVMCLFTGAEAGTLWLLDEEQGVIVAEVASGPTADKILKVQLKYGEGIVGRVISSNKSEMVADVTKDPNWASRVDKESGFVTRSMITVPLSAKNNVLGAIQLLNKKGGLFSGEDLKMAEALAHQSALALFNSRMYDDLQKFSTSVIRSLTLALDARDPYTAGHSERVALYSLWTAEKMGLSETQCRELERAAIMHDIGKIGVPDSILQKPGRLSDEEFAIMKSHPSNAEKILSEMEPRRQMVIAQEAARHHHEKVDGTGYPDRLKGDEISLYAKIIMVADAFDAITTDRPYKTARSFREGVEELVRCRGTHFDPEVVDAFAEIMGNRNYLVNNQERTKIAEEGDQP